MTTTPLPTDTHVALRVVIMCGGFLVFFMCVVTGMAALSIQEMFDGLEWYEQPPPGFFGSLGLGTVAGTFVVVMATYAVVLAAPRRRGSLIVAIVVTVVALVLLGGILLAYWRPFIRLISNFLLAATH